MNRKREKTEIVHDILQVIRDRRKVRPTHILYKSNLSHKMFLDYIKELTEKDLITETTDKKGIRLYELTEKGHKYLNEYAAIKEFMDSYGLNQEN